jgi:hypothetical protein
MNEKINKNFNKILKDYWENPNKIFFFEQFRKIKLKKFKQ